MNVTNIYVAAAFVSVITVSSASAGECTDQIKALQQSASMTDAKNKPGSQSTPTDTGSAKTDGTASVGADKGASERPQTSETAPKPGVGGGTVSASEKILEATAHDQRGEEGKCMESVMEAKKRLDT